MSQPVYLRYHYSGIERDSHGMRGHRGQERTEREAGSTGARAASSGGRGGGGGQKRNGTGDRELRAREGTGNGAESFSGWQGERAGERV